MNRYGQQAKERMRKFQPEALAGIEDPDSYFSSLGEDLESQINDLAERIAGPARPGETYTDRLGRLREARISAESDIMASVGAPLEEEPAEGLGSRMVTDWMALDGPVQLTEDELLIEQEREAERRQQA